VVRRHLAADPLPPTPGPPPSPRVHPHEQRTGRSTRARLPWPGAAAELRAADAAVLAPLPTSASPSVKTWIDLTAAGGGAAGCSTASRLSR
jgi:hypothetical protein